MLDVEKYLVHKCMLVSYDTTPTTPDAWNRSSHYGNTPTQTPCFVYFGEEEYVLDTLVGVPRQVYSAPTKWQIILPRALVNTLHNKDKVFDIRDVNSVVIREQGYIKDFKIYRHWVHGPMFVLGILGDGDDA